MFIRFSSESQTGNIPAVSSIKHSESNRLHASIDQHSKSADKTSLPQDDRVSGSNGHTRRSELSSEQLPLEVCCMLYWFLLKLH